MCLIEIYNEIFNKLKIIADSRYDEFLILGHAVAGINGPYNNCDTPVRNTSHWIVIYAFLYKETQEEKYLVIVHKLSEYLLRQDLYGLMGAIHCMEDDRMDHLNGLIGQAWAIEGLIAAYELEHDARYIQAAKKIFLSQRFDKENKLWSIVELSGKEKGYDHVYNHQLWFAAVGAELNSIVNDKQISTMISEYMNAMDSNLMIHSDGLVGHYCWNCGNLKDKLKNLLRLYLCEITGAGVPGSSFNQIEYEKSYHLYNVYGFAILKHCFPNHNFFEGKKCKKVISYAEKIENFEPIKKNYKYSYTYNSPAFEYPFAIMSFRGKVDVEILRKLWDYQNLFFDREKNMYSVNVVDCDTMTARIYEIVRFLKLVKMKEEDI